MTKPRHRRAGSRWRLQVHRWAGRKPGTPILYDVTHNVSSAAGKDTEHSRHHQLEGCDFDELMVGEFLHVEEMDTGTWWIWIGGVVAHITVDRDGRPKNVSIYGPEDYAGHVDNCTYSITWSRHEGG